MNKHERKHVGILERRRDFLTDLREKGETNAWDNQEIAALNWVLKDVVPERESAR